APVGRIFFGPHFRFQVVIETKADTTKGSLAKRTKDGTIVVREAVFVAQRVYLCGIISSLRQIGFVADGERRPDHMADRSDRTVGAKLFKLPEDGRTQTQTERDITHGVEASFSKCIDPFVDIIPTAGEPA